MNAGASAFWQFSLRFYRQPEVAPICIALQDQHAVDVNLLFFILFLAVNGRRLTADDVRRIDACIRDWRTRVVQPLRAIRRELKSGIAPIDTQASEALRSEIKRCEQYAERLQQEMLERAFPAATIGKLNPALDTAAANVAAYGTLIGALPAVAVQNLLRLFAEAFGNERGTNERGT